MGETPTPPILTIRPLRLAINRAASKHPPLRSMQTSPHTIRHATAMHLLQSGVDLSVIAMWLGHETTQTTHQYLDADLESTKRVLARLEQPRVVADRWHGRCHQTGISWRRIRQGSNRSGDANGDVLISVPKYSQQNLNHDQNNNRDFKRFCSISRCLI